MTEAKPAAAPDPLKRKYVVGHDDILLEYTHLYLPAQMPVFALGILYYFVINDGYKLKAM
jgi:hypothetical protein